MTSKHHKHTEESEIVDKPISFNFGIVKGKMTFKQFIIVLSVISVLSLIVFSSIKINNSMIQYSKDSLKVDKTTILRK